MKRKEKFIVFIFLLILIISAIFPQLALAASGTSSGSSNGGIVPCGNGSSTGNACTICHMILGIKNLVDFGLKLVVTAAVLGIVISGILYMVSSGNQTMMSKAKGAMFASVTGFAIVIGAWLLISTVLWLISAKGDLGIQKTGGWFNFKCDTKSSAGSGGSGGNSNSTSSDKKCCIKSKTKGEGSYGKSENCPEAKTAGTSKADCEKFCTDGGGDADYVTKCKSGCKDPEPTCSEGTLASGADCTGEMCGGSSSNPGTGNTGVVNCAKQYDAQNCQYSQKQRNACQGNPGYTDCSNLVETCYKAAGCSSPGSTSGIIGAKGESIGDKSTLQAGDVLWKEGHVVICEDTGCGTVIHASGTKDGIKESGGSYPSSFSKVIRASKFCS